MESPRVTVEQLHRLLPALEELEELRLSISAAAGPDPEKQWARSQDFATLDKRVISQGELDTVLAESESSLHEYIRSLFAALRPLLHSRWEGGDAAAAYELISLGEQQEGSGRPGNAERCYAAALAATLPLPDKKPQILALRRLGRVALAQSNLLDARQHYRRCAELARDAEEVRGEAVALTGLGNVSALQGCWSDAEAEYRAALVRAEADEGLELERAYLFNNLGLVTSRLGRFDESERWLSRAEEVWSRRESPADLAICLHDRAALLERKGDLPAARERLLAALELDAPAATRAVVGIDLAQNYASERLMTQAEEAAREAEELALAAKSPYVMGHVYRGRGNLARQRGQEGGLAFFEKALEIARDKSLSLLEGETLVDYALLRREMGGEDEAASYLARAREIFLGLGAVQELTRVESVLRQAATGTPPPAATR